MEPVSQTDSKLQADIAILRKDFLAADTNRDAVALRCFYTHHFTHIYASGKQDGKVARFVSVMAGEPTVKRAPSPVFRLSCFGEAACIARAQSD